MANFIVTTLSDELDSTNPNATLADFGGAGDLSLREALVLANAAVGADTITFAAGLAGQTLTLTQGVLIIASDVTIDGDVNGDNKADITIARTMSRACSSSAAARRPSIVSPSPAAVSAQAARVTGGSTSPSRIRPYQQPSRNRWRHRDQWHAPRPPPVSNSATDGSASTSRAPRRDRRYARRQQRLAHRRDLYRHVGRRDADQFTVAGNGGASTIQRAHADQQHRGRQQRLDVYTDWDTHYTGSTSSASTSATLTRTALPVIINAPSLSALFAAIGVNAAASPRACSPTMADGTDHRAGGVQRQSALVPATCPGAGDRRARSARVMFRALHNGTNTSISALRTARLRDAEPRVTTAAVVDPFAG